MERAGKSRSTGQPAAAGAGAIPARPRTPDPIHGGMRGKEMNKDEYRKLLLHPSWQKKRLEILSRDEFRCQVCSNDSETLHVHHLLYVPGNCPWEYPDHTLVTLCATCHEGEHESRGEYESGLLRELRRVGMLAGDVGTIRNLVAHLHAAYGHEKAKATLGAILEAMAWASWEPGAIDELVSLANDFVHKLLAPLESAGSQKDGSEAP